MKILISNDDGYQAKGLYALARIMSGFGDVTVISPKRHQSAMSMSVSLGLKKLAFKELPEMGPGRWAYLNATPVSCVKFGLEFFYENRDPDLFVSGINHGTNASMGANYSATLGCAEEGALNGIRSVGVSVCDFSPDADFSAVEAWFPGILRTLLDHWPDRFGVYYNVNFPALPASEIKGVRIARQGRGHWIREFEPWEEEIQEETFFLRKEDGPLEEGERAFRMKGAFVNDDADPETADHLLNDAGWITVVPFCVDLTDREEYGRMRREGLFSGQTANL